MSDGRLLYGQQYDEVTNVGAAFTQQMMDKDNADPLVGTAGLDISPNDRDSSLVRTYDVAGIIDSLDGINISFPGTANIALPAELLDIVVVFNKNSGDGFDYREAGASLSEGTSGGLNFNPSARATASASILPDVQVDIRETWGQNVSTTHYVFYLPESSKLPTVIARAIVAASFTASVVSGIVTGAVHGMLVNQPFQFSTVTGGSGGIAANTTYYLKVVTDASNFTYSSTPGGAALSAHNATSVVVAPTIASWPVFRPESITLTATGQQASIQQSAESYHMDRWSTDNLSWAIRPYADRSDGQSIETGVSIKTINIPPTIHGAITISSATDSAQVDTTVKANIPEIVGTGIAPSFAAVTNEPTAYSKTVNAAVSPTSISATLGITAIPAYGLYIWRVDAELYKYGLIRVHVEVVNFSQFQ